MSDLFMDERIRSANPFPDESLTGWAHGQKGRLVFHRIPRDGQRPFTPRRRRLRLVIPLVAALVVSAIAAGYAVSHRPTVNPLSVGCYESLSTEADTAFLSLRDELAPAERCAQKWQSAFGSPAPQFLVTCVEVHGVLGVFPRDRDTTDADACASIGASLPSEGDYGGLSGTETRAMESHIWEAFERIASAGCAPPQELRRTVREALDSFGATRWAIRDLTSSFAVEKNCAIYTIDSANATVLLGDGGM